MTGTGQTSDAALNRRERRLYAALAGAAVLLLLLTASELLLAYRDIERAALARMGLYSRVLETQTQNTLDGVAVTLRSTADVLESRLADIDPVHADRLLADMLTGQSALRSLSLLDARGRVLASTTAQNVDGVLDLALLGGMPEQRQERLGPYLAQRDLMSPPNAAGIGSLPMVRAVRRVKQEPLLLVALLNPDKFATQYAVLIGDAADAAGLFTYDGHFLLGGRSLPFEPGQRVSTLTPFSRHLPAQEHASYVDEQSPNGPAVSAFRTLRQWPLVVFVEQPHRVVRQGVLEHASWSGLVLFAGWMAVAVVGVLLRRGLKAEARAQHDMTQLHEQVVVSEQRWKLALDGAGHGVWELDLRTGVMRATGHLIHLLGLPAQEAQWSRHQWSRRMHPTDRGRVFDAVRRHFAGHTPALEVELRLRSASDDWHWVQARGTVVAERDAAGRPLRLVGTHTDVNEHKRAEAALGASQARNQAILQSALDGIVTVDQRGRVLDFNPAAEAMFGRQRADVLGAPMHELIIPPHLREAHQAGMARYAATGHGPVLNRRVEVEAMRADGSTFPVELTIVPVRSGEDEVYTATLRDITERLRVEAALRDSEARFRGAFEQAAVGLVQLDQEDRVLRVNPALCNMLGCTEAELLARPLHELMHPDDRAHEMRDVSRLFAQSSSSFSAERRYLHRQGHYVWGRVTASITQRAGGEPDYLLAIVEDISSRKQVERELADARERELHIGSQIQRSLLLPQALDATAGIWISSYSLASQGIDGDFVEVLQPGDGCVDLIAGDVMGKGVNAALMGAAVKMQFSRSLVELMTQPHRAAHDWPEPHEILAAVHRAMTPALQALEAFVTLCYVRIDRRRGRLTWVGCGHEEPVLMGADGALRRLKNQQPPLGVLDPALFEQDACALHGGEMLLLHSDGASDAFVADGRRLGGERLQTAFAWLARHHEMPGAVLQRMRQDLYHDARITDDLTLVAVRVPTGHADSRRSELPPELRSIAPLRQQLAIVLTAAALDPARAALFEVAVVEAFTNVVRHAQGRLHDAPVELLVERSSEAVSVVLSYVGDAYTPPDELPDTQLDAYPEGGFGLRIIRQACDEVRYDRTDGVNSTRLTLFV